MAFLLVRIWSEQATRPAVILNLLELEKTHRCLQTLMVCSYLIRDHRVPLRPPLAEEVAGTTHPHRSDREGPWSDKICLKHHQLCYYSRMEPFLHGGIDSIIHAVFLLRHASHGGFLRLLHCRALPNFVVLIFGIFRSITKAKVAFLSLGFI
jgi:hypothetical protein